MDRLIPCLVLLFVFQEILAQENTTADAVEIIAQDNTTDNAIVLYSYIHTTPQSAVRRFMAVGKGATAQKARKVKKGRSTSSSSASKEKKGSSKSKGESQDESLELSSEPSSSSDSKTKREKKYAPVSSADRKGWRKWHRKCIPCPREMSLKWKDPSIKWICGAYQRAQRSFKSLCMMHYRNCQDGTMFTKIHNHHCKSDNIREGKPHGEHFFYTYHVVQSGDTASTEDSSTSLSASDTDSALYKEDMFSYNDFY